MLKNDFLTIALSFRIYFIVCNNKVKTSTELKLTDEIVFQQFLNIF